MTSSDLFNLSFKLLGWFIAGLIFIFVVILIMFAIILIVYISKELIKEIRNKPFKK